MSKIRIAWLLATNNYDGPWAAIKYLFGRYPLADWEVELITSPTQRALQ